MKLSFPTWFLPAFKTSILSSDYFVQFGSAFKPIHKPMSTHLLQTCYAAPRRASSIPARACCHFLGLKPRRAVSTQVIQSCPNRSERLVIYIWYVSILLPSILFFANPLLMINLVAVQIKYNIFYMHQPDFGCKHGDQAYYPLLDAPSRTSPKV